MQRSRVYTLLGINTIVLYGLVLFLIDDATLQQWIVLGIAMVAMLIVPVLLIRNVFSAQDRELREKTRELGELRDELDGLRAHVAQVTTIDELTGSYNRRHLLDVLQQHRGMSDRGSYQFTLAVARVDQFTDLVDREGLERGNEVLQLFSRIVRAALREVDVIARLEADRFGLILSGCTEEDALRIINRISQLISQIQITDEDDVKITASGGLTSYHGTESPEELIEHAEQALQFAMEQGYDHVAGYLYTSTESGEAETVGETETSSQ